MSLWYKISLKNSTALERKEAIGCNTNGTTESTNEVSASRLVFNRVVAAVVAAAAAVVAAAVVVAAAAAAAAVAAAAAAVAAAAVVLVVSVLCFVILIKH